MVRIDAEPNGAAETGPTARAVITQARFATTVHAAVDLLDGPRPIIVELGPEYLDAIRGPRTSTDHVADGDDLIFLYTGGTTGMPKGVMWRNDDLYVALWQMGRPGTEPPDPLLAVRAGKRAATTLPSCPLMHGTGLFTSLISLSGGGSTVTLEARNLDLKKDAEAIHNRLNGKTFVAIRTSGDTGQLYGSVSARDVADIYQVPLVFRSEGVDNFILEEHFGIEAPPDLAPRFNVAPGQDVATVWQPPSAPRALRLRRWLLPPEGQAVVRESGYVPGR